jgi:transcriptional regulator with XRE-family HTH domain
VSHNIVTNKLIKKASAKRPIAPSAAIACAVHSRLKTKRLVGRAAPLASKWLQQSLHRTTISIEELASRSNVAVETLRHILEGRRAMCRTLERIAESFGIPLPRVLAAEGVKQYARDGLSRMNGKERPEYRTFVDMHRRVANPNRPGYAKYYGGAGVTISKRWANTAKGFRNFLTDMGPRPSKADTLHRRPPEANYGPGTCVWADKPTQALEQQGKLLVLVNGKLTGQKGLNQLAKEGLLNVIRRERDGTLKKSGRRKRSDCDPGVSNSAQTFNTVETETKE